MITTCERCGRETYVGFNSKRGICYKCREKEYAEELKEQILSGETDCTDCEDNIYCPWCGDRYEIDEEYELYTDGGHDLTCYHCGKKFEVTTNVSYSFDTERVDG